MKKIKILFVALFGGNLCNAILNDSDSLIKDGTKNVFSVSQFKEKFSEKRKKFFSDLINGTLIKLIQEKIKNDKDFRVIKEWYNALPQNEKLAGKKEYNTLTEEAKQLLPLYAVFSNKDSGLTEDTKKLLSSYFILSDNGSTLIKACGIAVHNDVLESLKSTTPLIQDGSQVILNGKDFNEGFSQIKYNSFRDVLNEELEKILTNKLNKPNNGLPAKMNNEEDPDTPYRNAYAKKWSDERKSKNFITNIKAWYDKNKDSNDKKSFEELDTSDKAILNIVYLLEKVLRDLAHDNGIVVQEDVIASLKKSL
jgi:hypothetical protein